MKRSLFYFAASALMLSACTSENVIEDVAEGRNAIQFESVVNKPSRATDLTMQNLEQFKVYGFYTLPDNPRIAHAIFNNVSVRNDGTGKWTYDGETRFWVDKGTYYFYAYSCGTTDELNSSYGTFNLDMNEDGTTGDGKDVTERTLEIDNYICDSSHQHDLIFASSTGYTAKDGTNDPVNLSFKHVLSKLMANFTSKFPAEYNVVIKNVSVRNVRNEGDYIFSKGWENVTRLDGVPLVYLLNTETDKDPDAPLTVTNKKVGDNQMSMTTNSAYVIPFEYQAKDVNLYFQVDVKYGNEYIIKNKALTATFQPNWKEGFSYMYNIEVSPENIHMGQIEFNVSVIKNWDEPTPNSEDITID